MGNLKHPNPTTKDVLLEKVRFYLTTIIDKEAFPDKNDVSIQMFYNEAVGRLYVNLRLMFVRNKVWTDVEKEIIYPKNLWNHLKKSIAERLPNFLGTHIHIKYEVVPVIVPHYHVCPHIGVSGKKGDHIQFLKANKETKENGKNNT